MPIAQPITADFAAQIQQASQGGYGAAPAPSAVPAPMAVPESAPAPAPAPQAAAVPGPAENVQAPAAAPAYDAAPAPVAPYGSAPVPPAAPLPKGLAVAALVLGIIAIAGCWIPFFNLASVLLGIVAFILGLVALSRVKKGRGAGKGMGIAGVVLGILAVIFSALIIVATVLFVQSGRLSSIYGGAFPLLESVEENGSVSVAPTADDSAPWTSLAFTLDDERFQLGETTLEEFGERSGWVLDLAAQGYPDGYIVQTDEEIVAISLSNPDYPEDMVQVSVANGSRDQQDLMKCQLSEVSIINESGKLACTLAKDVGLGSTMDEVVAAYGEPTYRFGSAEEGYWSINYDTDDYDKGIEFTAMEGTEVDRLLLSLD